MNRNEFIHQLDIALSGISIEERKDILSDYEEHFTGAMEDGKTEEEISASLGDPRAIARQFRAECRLKIAQTESTATNVFKAVLAAAGLGFLNLVFVLGPFCGLVGVLIGLFGVSIGFTAGGIAMFIAAIFSNLLVNYINIVGDSVFLAAIGIGMAALGALFFIGNCYITKFFFNGVIKYLKWNIDITKKAGGN